MRTFLIGVALVVFASPAMAGLLDPITNDSIESRAAAIQAQTKGSTNYHAYLARELATVAKAEKNQQDIKVAQAIMALAEKHAAKAGGK